jgi:hypothetical protein
MYPGAIYFEFENARSALLAQDTLEELGYKTGFHSELNRPALHIQLDQNELTSALEIAQAHGGRLLEHEDGFSDSKAFSMAYDEHDFISIPAHIVNEDWTDDYAAHSDNPASGEAGESDSGNGAEVFDPSGDDYNHFNAGVRL